MMPDHLILERFDRRDDQSGNQPRSARAGSQLENLLAREVSEPEIPVAKPEPSLKTDDTNDEDADAVADACDTDPVHDQLKEIAGTLARIAGDTERLEHAARKRWACALGRAVAEILPVIARDGFAGDLARTALNLSEGLGHCPIEIALHPDIVDRVRNHLTQHGTEISIELIPTPQIAADQAELRWTDGGAELDSDRLLTAVREMLKSRFPDLLEEDDRK